MDVSHVRQRVQAIADAAPDYERQHGLEDGLFIDVLTEIAKTSSDARARELAGSALGARRLAFERRCA